MSISASLRVGIMRTCNTSKTSSYTGGTQQLYKRSSNKSGLISACSKIMLSYMHATYRWPFVSRSGTAMVHTASATTTQHLQGAAIPLPADTKKN